MEVQSNQRYYSFCPLLFFSTGGYRVGFIKHSTLKVLNETQKSGAATKENICERQRIKVKTHQNMGVVLVS